MGLLVLVLALGPTRVVSPRHWEPCRPPEGATADPTLNPIPILDGSNVHNVGFIGRFVVVR